jgi:hypothetical protein
MISRADVHEALESARTLRKGGQAFGPRRGFSAEAIRHIVLSVIRELPEDMSMRELREELE